MTELRSPGSRVVLIGTQACANDVAAPPVPAVESTMEDLGHVLENRCGVRSEQIIRVLDSADPMRMGLAVAEAADQATDVLLVHYVGHGFVSADGELYLATKATDPQANRLEHSSVPFSTIRRSLLKSRARAIIVVLDCCFSGRAIGTLSAQEPIDLADVHGGYILTSAARDQVALAPPGALHTAFTGELIRLLDRGDPTGPAELSLRDVYRSLDRELHRRGFPRPRRRGSERIDDLVFAPNAAHTSAPALLPAPVSSQRPAARRRRRLLTVLMTAMAVVVATITVPMVWSGTSWNQPGSQPRSAPSASNSPQSFPEQADFPPVSLPRPTACDIRTNDASCERPAQSTARAADGTLFSVQRDGVTVIRYRQNPDGSWGKRENIGGTVLGIPVVIPDSTGKLVVFAVGGNGSLQYNPDIGLDAEVVRDNWTVMENVGDLHGRPTAAQDSEGKLEVFARGREGKLWRVRQEIAGDNGSWSGALGMGDTKITYDPKVHLDASGALQVFALDAEKRLRAWEQSEPAADDWLERPVNDRTLAMPPTVTRGGDGLLHLFARGTDGEMWQIAERSPASATWPEEWAEVPGFAGSGSYTQSPMSATYGNGTVAVFVVREDQPGRVDYALLSRPTPVTGALNQPIDALWSVTPDKDGRLVVQGAYGDSVVNEVP